MLQPSKRGLVSWRLLVAIALPVMLVLASCGDSDDDSDDGGATTTAAEDGGATTTAADDGGATTTAADEGGATTTAGGDDEGAAGGEGDCPNPATGEPIKLGDVTSASGTNIFPESANIAKLVFERYNCNGGLDGRPIELISVDAQDTAEGAAAAARNLAEEQQVLGFCCSGSIVNCFTNAGYYSENGWEVIPGVEACADAPTVHPTNTGPFLPTYHMLDYFKYDLGAENICFVGLNVPLTEFFQGVIIPTWEADSGDTVNQVIIEVGEDFTPAVTKLAADGCDAVEAAFTEPDYQAFFQIVDAQGLKDQMDFGMLTSGYSLQLLEASGGTLEGVYSNSEFEPYTGDESAFSDDVKDYIALAEAGGQPLTSFGQGGYISANVVIQALESIEGELTKESVNQAFKDVVYETPLLGTPFQATGSTAGIQPNQTSTILQVQDGDFVRVTDGWRVFPLPEDQKQAGGGGATTTTGG